MSDSLIRGFSAQLTISMDAVLRRAVFEIMNIFENTVYDYKMEIAHKGEEVAQLKIKLQAAELRLKDQVHGNASGQEMIPTSNQTETPPEAAPQTPAETGTQTPTETVTQTEPKAPADTLREITDVPEVDVDVPEDWCAPLGSETVTIQDVGPCPSIRLRPLSIPLWHIPICKTEWGYCEIGSKRKIRRHSKRITADSQNNILDKKVLVPDQRGALLKLKQESSDQAQLEDLRRSKRKPEGEVKTQEVKMKKRKRSSSAESRSTEVKVGKGTAKKQSEEIYTCKYCKKTFDTDFGQRVHARRHTRCSGCKKNLASQKLLLLHRLTCTKFKKKELSTTTSPPKPSSEGENMHTAVKKLTANKKESTTPSDSKLSMQDGASTKEYPCTHCDKKFPLLPSLKRHMRIHSAKWISCRLCPKTFSNDTNLKIHMTKAHKDEVHLSNCKEDLTWTEPLEVDHETQDLISICKVKSKV